MYDLLIIGGGVNGAGIARDAAGRGLKVLLCEKDDLASHTSSASTKLIHGGLRYLEHYDFALVRKALIEREVLLRAAPHIIWPLRFVLPHHKDLRPSWLIRTGLFLYDHLGGRELLPPTRTVKRSEDPVFAPLKSVFKKGFEYSDCWAEDSRLVVLNAMDASRKGADIRTRTECTALEAVSEHWLATLKSGGSEERILAKIVINAAGPWVDELGARAGIRKNTRSVRLVRGSHIIVPRMFDDERCFIFQASDDRIIFAIPYESGAYTLIGTTDLPFEGDLDAVQASDEEIRYLCDISNTYFEKQISPSDVVSTYSGVRPLFEDQAENASKVTRDYVLSVDETDGAKFVSVIGGKITTYRKLAEDVLKIVAQDFSRLGQAWTEEAPLPGGRIVHADFEGFHDECRAKYAWIPDQMLERLAHTHGSELGALLAGASSLEDLGRDYGCGLYQKEVEHFINNEFARTAEDILMRRTKIGLHMPQEQTAALEQAVSEMPKRFEAAN